MHPRQPSPAGFKRQVVFRIGTDDWPLLEQAATEHGSIQAAILAGLHALNQPSAEPATTKPAPPETPKPARAAETPPKPSVNRKEEITAREAASLLKLKAGTVRGYIRSGRISGYYRDTPGSTSWMTTRGAVEDYRRAVQGKR
ncbi:MAG TPA: hypothetical protein VE985_05470 [Gaiellaceae bacterium]|nr:hypothetical protein [Gaiellaceae bacterium]